MQSYCRELNHFYQREKALWEVDGNWQGFEWIDCSDYTQSVICFMRRAMDQEETLLVICNFTPEVHGSYRIGVPAMGHYQEVFNSDWEEFGGSGQKNANLITAESVSWQNQLQSVEITLPPLATIYLKHKQLEQINDI